MNKQKYLDQYIYPNWDKDDIIPPGIDSSLALKIIISHLLGKEYIKSNCGISDNRLFAIATYDILDLYPEIDRLSKIKSKIKIKLINMIMRLW